MNNYTQKQVTNPPKKYKNALIRPFYILNSAGQGVQRSGGALPLPLHRFAKVLPLFACL